jgi:hypothetical protein
MISSYVESINAGEVMTIADAWDAVVHVQARRPAPAPWPSPPAAS